jgi:hypothetical protein
MSQSVANTRGRNHSHRLTPRACPKPILMAKRFDALYRQLRKANPSDIPPDRRSLAEARQSRRAQAVQTLDAGVSASAYNLPISESVSFYSSRARRIHDFKVASARIATFSSLSRLLPSVSAKSCPCRFAHQKVGELQRIESEDSGLEQTSVFCPKDGKRAEEASVSVR